MSKVLAKAATFMPAHWRDGSVKAWTLLDAEDYEWAKEYRWFQDPSGDFRRNRRGGGGIALLHREIMGLKKGDPLVVDHLNRDNTDNRKANLRVVTRGQNAQNRKSVTGSVSKHRGVTWLPTEGKWRGVVQRRWTKNFDTEEEAAEWAREKRKEVLPYSIEE